MTFPPSPYFTSGTPKGLWGRVAARIKNKIIIYLSKVIMAVSIENTIHFWKLGPTEQQGLPGVDTYRLWIIYKIIGGKVWTLPRSSFKVNE